MAPFPNRFKRTKTKSPRGSDILNALAPAARAEALRQLKSDAPKASASSFNKFNVAPEAERTLNGQKFDSKLEMRIYRHLCLLIDPKRIEQQVEFELVPKQTAPSGKKYRAANYRADFVIDGTYVVDAKGLLTPEFKTKAKVFLHRYGKEIICIKNLKELNEFVNSLPK